MLVSRTGHSPKHDACVELHYSYWVKAGSTGLARLWGPSRVSQDESWTGRRGLMEGGDEGETSREVPVGARAACEGGAALVEGKIGGAVFVTMLALLLSRGRSDHGPPPQAWLGCRGAERETRRGGDRIRGRIRGIDLMSMDQSEG